MLCALHVEVVAAVEVAVADGFHDVVLLDTRSGLEVGDGAGDLEDAVGDGFHDVVVDDERRALEIEIILSFRS